MIFNIRTTGSTFLIYSDGKKRFNVCILLYISNIDNYYHNY